MTRRFEDLRAWCQVLVDAKDWTSALSAFDESAEIVADIEYARPQFLDGAALAAQELGRSDLNGRLERAWRAGPSMSRLCRWLGSAGDKAALRMRAAEALATCPRPAHQQRALLHVAVGDFGRAAELLTEAAGLGWSGSEHPGHLLFPLFEGLLDGQPAAASLGEAAGGMCMDSLEMADFVAGTGANEARLAKPDVAGILELADMESVTEPGARSTLVEGMRKAAEKRLAGVAAQKRRRHYGHAAGLVAACLRCDRSPAAIQWAAAIREEYRRFPALRAELDRALRLSEAAQTVHAADG